MEENRSSGGSLSGMTLEELWELFPIRLAEPDPAWREWYADEAADLRKVFPEQDNVRISHIGSTAIKGICAKPIVDILVELPAGSDMEQVKARLIGAGYLCMCEGVKRKSFNKGYTVQGYAERVFHLHLRFWGDCDELYFRDFLNTHPDIAKEYENLKHDLLKRFGRDRDGYTLAKSEFVTRYTGMGKQLFGDRW